jgi:hypothetical protein
VPGKHTVQPEGLARFLPTRLRLSALRGPALQRAASLRAAWARLSYRTRVVTAATAALVLLVGVAGLFVGPGRDLPRFMTGSVPVIPVGEVAVSESAPVPSAATTHGVDPAGVPVGGGPVSGGPVGGGGPGTGSRGGASAAPGGRNVTPGVGVPPGSGSKPPPAGLPATMLPSAPDEGVTAQYAVTGSWDTGFVAGVLLANPTGTARSWQVVVRHASAAGVRVTTFWNAQVTRNCDTTTFSGGPLAAGATQTFGFEATKQASGPVRPTSCLVNGLACDLR